MIIEEIRRRIEQSGKSRYQISKDTGIDEAALCRIMQGGSCKVETADVLFGYFGLGLAAKSRRKIKRRLAKADLDEMLHQVRYEHAMLTVVGDYIIGGKIKDGILRNALLESFVVHARNLIDFSYTDEAKFSDDVLAIDYFSSPDEWIGKRGKLPKYLDEARAKANKLLSHITVSRIKKYKSDKDWPVLKIKQKIDEVIKCFEKERTF